MNNKLDVFEILGVNNNKDKEEAQEQVFVPELDLTDIRKCLDKGPERKTMSDKAKKVSKSENKPKDETPKFEPVWTEPVKLELQKAEKAKVKKAKEKRPKAPKKKWSFVKWLVLLVVAILFFTFVVNISNVTVNSMAPLISKNDKVVVSKLAKTYKVGDIIAFRNHRGQKLIARIVAKDGDVVKIEKKGGLYINNKLQEEEYVSGETTITDARVTYPVIVGENEYFVLGDNRDDAQDSRTSETGLVSKDDILGKVIYCFKGI